MLARSEIRKRFNGLPRMGLPVLLFVTASTAVIGNFSAFAQSSGVANDQREAVAPSTETIDDRAAMDRFLDRLMASESGGRDHARNPRSTAVGAFQFIESTFLDIAKRHFPSETAKLSDAAILALRTNRAFARRAAEAYSRDNASHLAALGLATTFANLRLAFLVGPAGAADLLKSPNPTPVVAVLGARVVRANPFMSGMTSGELASWSERSLRAPGLGSARVGVAPGATADTRGPPKVQLKIRCARNLASCRKWVSLAMKRQNARQAGIADRASKRR